MNILIDPYMLELEDENEIRSNISFFETLCFLCKSNKISIFLYKDMVEKMLARDVKPFPIFLGQVRDEKLKETVRIINTIFVNVVMKNISSLDIEACCGEQNFKISSVKPEVVERLSNDAKYYELLSVLLQSCYNKKIVLSQSIITGVIHNGLSINDEFDLKCQCIQELFKRGFRFENIEKLESLEDKAFIELFRMVSNNEIEFILSPKILRGKHHNFLQKNSDFITYEGLSRINKLVISLLRKFGLSKIIFEDFHEDSSHPKGFITTYDVSTTSDNDIVNGWLYAETGFRNHVKLYFPKTVGKNLHLYLGGEFDKNRVERLIDSLF